jgi:serine/threonine protein kinase
MASHLLADMGSRCRRGFKFPLWLSDGAKDFITAALAFDPVKRLSLGAALDHPWVLALSFTPANAVDRWVFIATQSGRPLPSPAQQIHLRHAKKLTCHPR